MQRRERERERERELKWSFMQQDDSAQKEILVSRACPVAAVSGIIERVRNWYAAVFDSSIVMSINRIGNALFRYV